ncbi:unnamed protein product, partial [Cuscuta epithymum]
MDGIIYLINKDRRRARTTLLGPYFMQQVLNKKIDNNAQWEGDRLLVKTNWSSFDTVLTPLNVGNSHWVLVQIDLPAKMVRVYDSMRNGRTVASIKDLWERLPHLLRVITWRTEDDVASDLFPWEVVAVDGVPQQRGGGECGMMVLSFAEHLMLELPFIPGCEYENMATKRCEFANRLWMLK